MSRIPSRSSPIAGAAPGEPATVNADFAGTSRTADRIKPRGPRPAPIAARTPSPEPAPTQAAPGARAIRPLPPIPAAPAIASTASTPRQDPITDVDGSADAPPRFSETPHAGENIVLWSDRLGQNVPPPRYQAAPSTPSLPRSAASRNLNLQSQRGVHIPGPSGFRLHNPDD